MKREIALQVLRSVQCCPNVGDATCASLERYIAYCEEDDLYKAAGMFSNALSSAREAFTYYCFQSKTSPKDKLSELLNYSHIGSGFGQGFSRILPYQIVWRIFDSADKKHLMSKDDLAFYDSLPKEIKVYRGGILARNSKKWFRDGVSWTVERQVAIDFAKRYYVSQDGKYEGVVCTGLISKTNVVAYFDDRNEKEIVCNPSAIQKRKYEVVDL